MPADQAWARLVNINDITDVVNISSDKFTIGRLPVNDLSFPHNKLISQNHCYITREDEEIYLTDSSTNGTQVDGTKVKQRKAELKHGDEIHIVFKKNSVENNIAYIFEEVSKTLPSDSLEATQEYEPVQATELEESEPPRKKMKQGKGDTPAAADDTSAAVEQKAVADVRDKIGDTNEIDEALLCIICQELLHDCVSLQPCMHTFCAGCFSQWMTKSKLCPTCRKKATSVAQNHILRNLIEVYLKSHPEKKRDPADIAELDKHNTIRTLNHKLTDCPSENEDYSEDEEYDEHSDSSSSSFDEHRPNPFGPIVVPSFLNMSVPVCRQCTGYNNSRLQRMHDPPASDAADDATPGSGYVCTQGTQKHVVCYCCMEMFPDRRDSMDSLSVSCEVCSGTFCHLYWKCKRPDCKGCLNKLKDMQLVDSLMDNILLQNSVESNILKDYMQSKSLTMQDIIQSSCSRLDRGEFLLNNDFGCNFSGKGLKGDSIICYRCGSKALRQLAYHYRKNIPANELPDAVTEKADCYWGKNCRTQKKPGHALKLNHICEQTRFN